MKIETSVGVWHVRRRWAPRHLGSQTIWARFLHRSRKVRRRTAELSDLPDPGCAPDLAEGIVVFIVLVVVIVFLFFIGIPFLIALGEFVFVVVLAAAGIIGRVLFRRPWTLDAVGPSGEHYDWSVLGWKASGAARQCIADRITKTGAAPTDEELAAAVLSW
ncbi:MAG: hypothetical protein ACRDZN_03695 [Acidimicrobiales bacterium]